MSRSVFAAGRLEPRGGREQSRPVPRPSQWRAIREMRHQLVAAGAGTGKTFTVVNRVLYLLGVKLDGERHPDPIRLRELVAITYTNQAAADLKAKLRQALREHGRAAEANEVDLARIGTIHAFCGDVIRDFALRTGRGPIRTVRDEGEAAAATDDAARDALVDALERDAVPGLDALLADWSSARVVDWVMSLVSDSDQLAALRRTRAELDGPERTLIDLATRAERRLLRRMERDGAVDFDRMVVWTRDLIRDDPSVRRTLQRRIRALIIDEFQDVDPVQKEMAYLLAEPLSGRQDTPRLMLVGDPKQSIYRFRRADVTVWREVERDFQEGHGVVVPLEDNFRSVPPVLGLVDATVGRILDRPLNGDEHQDFEVPYRRVAPTRPAAEEPAVEAILVPARPDEDKTRRADDVRAIEAAAVARRARELNRAGVEWGDMALLLRSWNAVELYEQALRDAGIPVYTLRGEGFLERREVVDLINALETVREPRDDRALMGFLRSPFVGVRDDTLLRIARDLPRPYWWRLRDRARGAVAGAPAAEAEDRDARPPEQLLGGLDVEEASILTRALRMLDRFVALRDRVPTAALLEELLLESGYLGHLALLGEDGRQRIANVRQFVNMAEGAADTALGDFLRAVRERRSRQDRIAEAPIYGEADDVVTITTVHSAKGLEWSVVFWVDLVRGAWQPSPDLLVNRGEMRLARPGAAKGEQPEAYQSLLDRVHEEEAAEDRRLWYVAATRAKDRLILSGIPKGAKGLKTNTTAHQVAVLLDGLREQDDGERLAFGNGEDGPWELLVRVADTEARALDEGAGEAAETVGTVRDPEILQRPRPLVRVPLGRTRHSATELLVHDRCRRRHWYRYVAGLPEPDADASEERLVAAVRRGQIVHEVLERIREEDELPGLLEAAIGRWDEHAPPPDGERGRRYRAHLREEVENVLEHPDYREIFDRPDARRELGFAYIHADGIAATGRIDLAAPGGNGLRLLDVKTTQCDADAVETKVAQYGPQRDVYVTAAEAIAGTPVDWFAFQFTRARVHARQRMDDDARDRARGAFDLRAREVGAGRTDLTEHPEECWFCGYGRAGICPGAG